MPWWISGQKAALVLFLITFLDQAATAAFRRLVVLKVDGLNADLLQRGLTRVDPATNLPTLPWLNRIFREQGIVFENFYSRGISLSAPSWSVLDSGQHTVIRGNVEYDRYTGRTYDYLNFFPLFLNYARGKQVDMPAVEEMDRAGVSLMIDRFGYTHAYQSFQLLQHGVQWTTLRSLIRRRLKSELYFLSPEENIGPEPFSRLLNAQSEQELLDGLQTPDILYLDLYLGDIDHIGHATNDEAALLDELRHLDTLAGRVWTGINKSALGPETLFVLVSDHGMNNRPGILSQSFSLPDFFTGFNGGGHHVITNRHPLSDYKLRGLDPIVQRAITPSRFSPYVASSAAQYPTAWLDLDGNERASVYLRNSDHNILQLVLQELARPDLPLTVRAAAASYLNEWLERNRTAWQNVNSELAQELAALGSFAQVRRDTLALPRNDNDEDARTLGMDRARRRAKRELTWWQREIQSYTQFISHRGTLIAFHPDQLKVFGGSIADLVPERQLSEQNSIYQLQNYVVGLGPDGLVVSNGARLDLSRSFRHINYFSTLVSQAVRNNPQPALAPNPIAYVALRLPQNALLDAPLAIWVYASEERQLLIEQASDGRLRLQAIQQLRGDENGNLNWNTTALTAGFPLAFFEDKNVHLPPGADAATWLTNWHTEREWMAATHACEQSTAVVGLVEQMSTIDANVPGAPGADSILLRYERRRRALAEPDFQVFSNSGWNFNARDVNPGGNHGGFYRLSTHAVWMMTGTGLTPNIIKEPFDGLNFASTILQLLGMRPPMPDRVVTITTATQQH